MDSVPEMDILPSKFSRYMLVLVDASNVLIDALDIEALMSREAKVTLPY